MSLPGIINYPTTLDDAVSLLEAADRTSTPLTGAITNVSATIPIITTSYPNSGLIVIEQEIISYNGKTASALLNAQRGLYGTTAAPHAAGKTVSIRYVARYHGVISEAIQAIEAKIGAGASLPTAAGQYLVATGAGTTAWQTPSISFSVISDTISDAQHGIRGGGNLHSLADAINAGFMSSAQFTKLNGIATGATVNQTDTYLLSRANHTGTQLAATISDFNTSVDARITSTAINTALGYTAANSAAVVSKAGDVMSGNLTSPSLRVGSVSGYVSLSYIPGGTVGSYADQKYGGLIVKDNNDNFGHLFASKISIGRQVGDNPQFANYDVALRITSKYYDVSSLDENGNSISKWIGVYNFSSIQNLTASTPSTQDFYGINNQIGIYNADSSNTFSFFQIIGNYNIAYHQSYNPSSVVMGATAYAYHYGYAPITNTFRGLTAWARTIAGPTPLVTIAHATGIKSVLENANAQVTITSGKALEVIVSSNNGVINNASGIHIMNAAIGGYGTNKYGLFIDAQTVATPANWSGVVENMHIAGNVPSVIEGTVRLGATGVASGRLELRGTTSGTVGITVAAVAGTWNLRLPTAAPTVDGQVLSGNADGTTSWITPSSGGGSIINPTNGYVPLRTSSTAFGDSLLYQSGSQLSVINGQLITGIFSLGTTGGAVTINFNNGNKQSVTLNAATTLTFSNGVAGATYTLEIIQDTVGGQTITWPASVKWEGGIVPTISSAAGKKDLFSFFYDGTDYLGTYSVGY